MGLGIHMQALNISQADLPGVVMHFMSFSHDPFCIL